MHSECFSVFWHTIVFISRVNRSRIDLQAVRIVLTYCAHVLKSKSGMLTLLRMF
jgi:hypothetical protein